MDKSYIEYLRITKRKEKRVDTYKRGTSISKTSKLMGNRSKSIIDITPYRDRGHS